MVTAEMVWGLKVQLEGLLERADLILAEECMGEDGLSGIRGDLKDIRRDIVSCSWALEDVPVGG